MTMINLQTRILFRLMMPIFIITGGLCLFAVWVGSQTPAHIVYAHTYDDGLLWVDTQRSITITFDYPIPSSNRVFSENGKRAILSSNSYPPTFVLWDITTGKIIHIPKAYEIMHVTYPSWLPDNRTVILHNGNDANGAIYSFDFDSLEFNIVHMSPAPVSLQWSSDNRHFFFREYDGYRLLKLTRQILQSYSNDLTGYQSLVWHPGGISVVGIKDGILYRYWIDTRVQEIITNRFHFIPYQYQQSLFISPDGTWLAFINADGQLYNINLINREIISFGNAEFMLNNVNWVLWSPNSDSLIFELSSQSHPSELYLSKPDGSNTTNFSSGSLQLTAWSPDATKIAYVDSKAQLWIWDFIGEPLFISNDAGVPIWSDDSTAIAFSYTNHISYNNVQLGYYSLNNDVLFFAKLKNLPIFGFIKNDTP